MPDDPNTAEIMRQARGLQRMIRVAAQTVRYRQAIGAPLPKWITDMRVEVWLAVRRRIRRG